ncbi:hypothetical protein AEAC466_04520 [Asticcacaulis sp. AC466]|uniref:hypothetical protein n=1 Tax=Asticcacaulis sp. AC466 TaxID=1282362 RepID=UPI0003C40FC6|nr:hypothetical protein [Asticcacaulis sp. AC466]ESQ85433.1 hypothetical protein AEAC466_04520 [Asticcacaulis sp. AC466]
MDTLVKKGPYIVNDCLLMYGQVSGDEDEAPFIADFSENGTTGEYTDAERATAEYFERAVNAFPAMLAALEELISEKKAPIYNLPPHAQGVIRSAIAQAKGDAV